MILHKEPITITSLVKIITDTAITSTYGRTYARSSVASKYYMESRSARVCHHMSEMWLQADETMTDTR